MNDPLENQRLLIAAISKKAEELGLELHRVAFVPATEHGETDYVEVSMRLTAESVMTAEERIADAEIKSLNDLLLLDSSPDSTVDKAKEALDELHEARRKAQGWLGQ